MEEAEEKGFWYPVEEVPLFGALEYAGRNWLMGHVNVGLPL